MEPVFRRYEDILQNIEFAVIITYREHPELTDYNVTRVYERLVQDYKAEMFDRPPSKLKLSELEQELYDAVRGMCEWRMGRAPGPDGGPSPTPVVSVDDIVLCLKRLQKSVKTWTRQGGRQGYLNFVSPYIK